MLTKKKVLLIEDDRPTGAALTHLLKREGMTVTHVRKGEDAYEAAARVKPDIVLLDLKLAGPMDGFAVLGQLKGHPMLARVPVLIVTNYGLIQDIQRGLAAGADEYLVKSDHSIHDIARKAAEYAAGGRKK